MERSHLWLALVGICVGLGVTGPLWAAQEEQVSERVFLVRDKPGSPTQFQMIVLAGCGDEPGGQCLGLAHYLEHLILTGRNREHADTGVRIFPDAVSNGWTNLRATAYVHTVPARETGPRPDLEKLFAFYAARLKDFAVTEAEAIRERNVVLQEHDWRVASNPNRRFEQRLDRELLPDHPAGQWTIGTRDSIVRLTVPDAQAFHRIWYATNNSYFLVRADISASELNEIAQQALAGIEPKKLPPRVATNRPPAVRVERRDLRESDPQVKRASVVYKKLIRVEDADNFVQRAARLVIGSYLRSRLAGSPHAILVEKANVAADTPAIGIDLVAPKTIVLRISAEVAHDANPDALLAAIATYADGLAGVPLPTETVERLKRRFADAYANEEHDPAIVYSRLVGWLAQRSAYQDYRSWPARVAAVKDADVAHALRALAAPGKVVTGVLLPAGEDLGK